MTNCYKLTIWRNVEDKSPTILIGIISNETDQTIEFLTGSNKKYFINKKLDLFSIKPTNVEFREGN